MLKSDPQQRLQHRAATLSTLAMATATWKGEITRTTLHLAKKGEPGRENNKLACPPELLHYSFTSCAFNVWSSVLTSDGCCKNLQMRVPSSIAVRGQQAHPESAKVTVREHAQPTAVRPSPGHHLIPSLRGFLQRDLFLRYPFRSCSSRPAHLALRCVLVDQFLKPRAKQSLRGRFAPSHMLPQAFCLVLAVTPTQASSLSPAAAVAPAGPGIRLFRK